MSFSAVSEELGQLKEIIGVQVVVIFFLSIAGLGVWLITIIAPGFFNYPYFTWGGWEALMRFWPVFLWAAALAILGNVVNSPVGTSERQKILNHEIVIAVLAGVLEELAYRWIYICYTMIFLVALNWMLGVGLGWLHADPVLWFYHLLVWIIHYATLFQMDTVLYGGHDQLFLFGAILANSWFRNGHKYQGVGGLINSWYMGMVFLYATVTYGLLTAIVIHVLYDIEIFVIPFILSKIRTT